MGGDAVRQEARGRQAEVLVPLVDFYRVYHHLVRRGGVVLVYRKGEPTCRVVVQKDWSDCRFFFFFFCRIRQSKWGITLTPCRCTLHMSA